jgi:hypothetical protein
MLRAVFTGLAIFALATPAVAAPKKQARPPASIEIHNQRKVALTSFALSTPGEDGKAIGALAKPLAAGAKARIQLKNAKGCAYVAKWEFEDAGDEGQVDLCHDPKIVLTD